MTIVSIKNRIKKLEGQQPNEFDLLSDEELEARVEAELTKLKNDPETQAWLADDSCTDPLRYKTIEAIKRYDEKQAS